jgi:hypothetical protein
MSKLVFALLDVEVGVCAIRHDAIRCRSCSPARCHRQLTSLACCSFASHSKRQATWMSLRDSKVAPASAKSPQGLVQRFLDSSRLSTSKAARTSYPLSYSAAHALKRESEVEKIRERNSLLAESIDDLVRLWRRIGMLDSEQTQFLAGGGDLPYAAKIARIRAAHDSALQCLVRMQRAKIVHTWEELKMGEHERSQFHAFRDEGPKITDETLLQHDRELAALTDRLEKTKPLLRKVDAYQRLLDERDSLAEAISQPNRLLDRHTNSYRWRNAEQRLHSLNIKVLPERKGCLLADLTAWEESSGIHLIVDDEPFLDKLRAGTDKVYFDETLNRSSFTCLQVFSASKPKADECRGESPPPVVANRTVDEGASPMASSNSRYMLIKSGPKQNSVGTRTGGAERVGRERRAKSEVVRIQYKASRPRSGAKASMDALARCEMRCNNSYASHDEEAEHSKRNKDAADWDISGISERVCANAEVAEQPPDHHPSSVSFITAPSPALDTPSPSPAPIAPLPPSVSHSPNMSEPPPCALSGGKDFMARIGSRDHGKRATEARCFSCMLACACQQAKQMA